MVGANSLCYWLQPQSLNRYSYVGNNPVRYTDPDGHCFPLCTALAGAIIGGIVGAASVALPQMIQNVQSGQPLTANIDPNKVASAAIGGALLGGAIGAGVGAVAVAAGVGATVAAGAEVAGGAVAACAETACGEEVETAAQDVEPAAQQLASEAKSALSDLVDNCANSFSADTLVATDHGERAIGELRTGDQVLAYNQSLGTTGAYPVTATLVHTDPVVEDITIDGERIETTPEHPFFTLESKWVLAGLLWKGEHVRKADGRYGVVQAVQLTHRSQVMYNLTVATAHTFFVGHQQWLVHNACFKGGPYNEIQGTGDLEAHHLIAKAVSLNPENELSIEMEHTDHILTASYGSSTAAQNFRANQEFLIENGLINDALKMGIDNMAQFGSKYADAIVQAQDHMGSWMYENVYQWDFSQPLFDDSTPSDTPCLPNSPC